MDEFWEQVDLDRIKQIDEYWHWNVTNLIQSKSVKNVRYFECPMYVRLIILFEKWVRIDEYSKQDGSNPAGTMHTVVIDQDDMKFMRCAFRNEKEKKLDTWDTFLKRVGAKEDI